MRASVVMVPGCASILYSIGVCAISFDGPLTYLQQRGLRTSCAGRTGSDAFESAPPRKCVRPLWFHLLFKTENSKESLSTHHCITRAMAVVAASVMTLLPVYAACAQGNSGSSTKTPIKHVVAGCAAVLGCFITVVFAPPRFS